MKLYANIRLLSVEDKSFVDRTNGEKVQYYVNIVKDVEDGGAFTLNSKADYSALEGRSGVGEFMTREQDGGVKLTLRNFTPDTSFEIPEGEIS